MWGLEDGDDTREERAESKWVLCSIVWSQLRLRKQSATGTEVISGRGGGLGSPACQFREGVVLKNLSFSIANAGERGEEHEKWIKVGFL